ncbi:MAG: peptidylprolyl isomerase [Balneolales bacterium]|nr:peptidylprolyl isomerase [Balneolales bacterium]
MKYFLRLLPLFLVICGISTQQSEAQQRQVLDKIVAVVNDQIILKSDIDARVTEFLSMRRGIEFSEELWFDVLENVIDNNVLYEQARLDSVIVSEDQVSRAMDERIRQLIAQVGSERALEEALGQSLVQVRNDFRDQFRREMKIQQRREMKERSIRITRPEVEAFFNRIPQDSLPVIPETVELSQIIIFPPQRGEAERIARQKAEALRDSVLNHDVPFEDIARRHSQGAGANRGGLIPLMPINDLVAEYAAAASALQPGGISEVVRTRAGFHVIRLNRRAGDQIETSQILITVDEEQLDEDFAINKLTAIRDSVLTHEVRFSDLARRHSDDRNSAVTGGRIINQQTGQRRLAVEELEPSLYRAIINLQDTGDITEPARFTFRDGNQSRPAFRIIRMNSRIEEHTANLEMDFDIIRNIALQEKRMNTMMDWIQELRREMYIEYRIHSPYASN